MDWHELALGLVALLVAIGGWTWQQNVKWLSKLSDDFKEHKDKDAEQFAELVEKVNEAQLKILDRISGRWSDRSK